jgi:hypothetical protein
MCIHKIGSDSVPSAGPEGARDSGSEQAEGVKESAPVRPVDTIDISPEGPELMAIRDKGASEPKLQQVRERIRDGFYNNSSVADRLAERLLADGVVKIVISRRPR